MKTWAAGSGGDGLPEGVPGMFALSLRTLVGSGCLLAPRSFRLSRGRALLLIAIKWSFLVLLLGTAVSALNAHLPAGFLHGGRYLAFKAVLNGAGILFLAGVLVALLRRAFAKNLPSTGYDYFLLTLLLLIALTPFLMQGVRFASGDWADARWSPLGGLFALAFSGIRAPAAALAYNLLWAAHALLSLFFIAYIPYSGIFHVFAAQITTHFAGLREREAHMS
jgi:nitrate reductase gamma subunit